MKQIKLFLLALLVSASFISCDDNDETIVDHIEFEVADMTLPVEPGADVTVYVKAFTENISSEDRYVNVVIDDSNAVDGTYIATANKILIPANKNRAVFPVTIPVEMLTTIDMHTISINLEENNNMTTGDAFDLTYYITCLQVEAYLTFRFDYYPSDVSWEILDEDGNVIMTSPVYSQDLYYSYADEVIALCGGGVTYTLNIYDAYGDGLGYYDGWYEFVYKGQILASGQNNYGASVSHQIYID